MAVQAHSPSLHAHAAKFQKDTSRRLVGFIQSLALSQTPPLSRELDSAKPPCSSPSTIVDVLWVHQAAAKSTWGSIRDAEASGRRHMLAWNHKGQARRVSRCCHLQHLLGQQVALPRHQQPEADQTYAHRAGHQHCIMHAPPGVVQSCRTRLTSSLSAAAVAPIAPPAP